jgi:hypothetical protein
MIVKVPRGEKLKPTNLFSTALSFLLALGVGTSALAGGPGIAPVAGAPVKAAPVKAAPVIGMTSGQSGVLLDNAKVGSSATLFDGSTVQTTRYSRLHLNDGTRLDLAADSKAQVFAGRATLESGITEVQSASGYEIDTKALKIRPTGASSVARVRIDGADRVFVTALNAPVNVLNKNGTLLAKVNPGLPLSFLPQAAGASAFDKTGCVLEKSGVPILVDQSGNEVTELRGADLRKVVGNRVHVTGSLDSTATPAGGGSQVVDVVGSNVTSKGGCAALASQLGASASPAGLATGTSAAAGGGATGGVASAGAASPVVGVNNAAIIVTSVAAATAISVGAAAAGGAFSSSSP